MSAFELNMADQFALDITDQAIDLDRYSASVRKKILSNLKRLEIELVRQIELAGIEDAARITTKQKRAEALLKKVRGIIDSSFVGINGDMKSELHDLAIYQHEATINMANNIFGAELMAVSMNKAELKALANRNLVLGLSDAEHWKGRSESLKRAYAAEVRVGYIAGETNQQIIQRIRGTSTGKRVRITLPSGKTKLVHEFSGGIMDTTTREARTLVRTSVQSVSNEVIHQTYLENDDIVKGVEALVTLDGKTTLLCISRAGNAWYLNGEPIEESGARYPYPGPPPWHFNCRTVELPLTYSWEELAERATGKKSKLLNSMPARTRASMDGLIPGNVRDFEDWYKIKGDAFARKQLGKGRFDLWKSGKISLKQLVDQSGRPLTIEQLKEKYKIVLN